jgi:hypothetical protein
MDLGDMTGAAGTIELGGRTFLLRDLTFRDRAQLKEWVRSRVKRPMTLALEALKDLEPLKQSDPETYRALADKMTMEAFKEHKEGHVSEQAALALLDSMDGAAFFLWLRIRHEQPNVTLEEVRVLLENEDPKALARKLKELAERDNPDLAEDKPADPPRPTSPA